MSLSSILKPVREDDFVEYFLFPSGLNQTDVSLENCEPLLESLLAEVNKLSKDYCQRYIWHRDGFKVNIRKGDLQQRLLIEANERDANEGRSFHQLSFRKCYSLDGYTRRRQVCLIGVIE